MALNINMSATKTNVSYDTVAPYSYNEWLTRNPSVLFNESTSLYNEYIRQWYQYNDKIKIQSVNTIKQDYINLLKELTHFFTEEEKNLFLRDIDFTNDVEIVYAIPFFVSKLKEIALTVSKKRETIKNSKLKFAAAGSNKGIENILYEYILKSHTKVSNTTQISLSSLGETFPELSAVKNDFSLEIEELYDIGVYADTFTISNNSIQNDILSIIPNIAANPLFAAFSDFLYQQITETVSLSSTEDYTEAGISNIYNQAKAASKYIGNTLYGLTAVKFNAAAVYDAAVTFNMLQGNNWFYWPSGETFTDIDSIKNVYDPIELNSAVFKLSGATAGNDYTSSDLLFIESRGIIEGAWLKGNTSSITNKQMVMTAQPGDTRTFIYPKPGYGLTTSYQWSGRVVDDENLLTFNLLDPQIRQQIIKKYFSAGLETEVGSSLYINHSNIVYGGATAGDNSLSSDTILVRPGGAYNDTAQISSAGVYNDSNITKEAFLYKLTSSEIPITFDDSLIVWPLTSTNNTTINIAEINITPDTCNDVFIGAINTNQQMVGAVGGRVPAEADIIHKMSSPAGGVLETAWLCTGSIKSLATYNTHSILVYDTPATMCVKQADGPIQPNLSFIGQSNSKTSFIWCDIDTPADDVFKYIHHSPDCQYIQISHDYTTNTQDSWTTCSCRSVNYSPLGHTGDSLTDFYGSADYLFADPQGLGDNFTLTQWRDTRGYNYKSSPQFSYYKKADNTVDNNVGWGPGRWKTGTGVPMILKTGRRYTYYRTGMRSLNTDTSVPTIVAHYPYQNIISSDSNSIPSDIILVVDASGSQYYSITKIKQLASRIIENIDITNGSQLGVVVFNDVAVTACYLTGSKERVLQSIENISINSTDSSSDIKDGINVAYTMLTEIFGGNGKSLASLCTDIKSYIATPYNLTGTSNFPITTNQKVILLFSDGAETLNEGKALLAANTAKNNKITVVSVDIGPNSGANNLMERIASSTSKYFNYEQALLQEDTIDSIYSVANHIVYNINGSTSIKPTWRKGFYTQTEVLSSTDVSDMVFRAGDILKYTHRQSVVYDQFTTSSAPFVINIPLYGWNYDTKAFDGKSLGAKPYWGIMYNYTDYNSQFTRYARSFGGQIRFFEDVIPLSHPIISPIQFNNNDYIEYRNKGCELVVWKDNISFVSTTTNNTWCKLDICTQAATLKDLFSNITTDKIFEQTNTPSDIVLATYGDGDYAPAYYCYFAHSEFHAVQPLTKASNHQIFSQILSSVVIDPAKPYLNLTNTHYGSIAYAPLPSNLITAIETGAYLTPVSLGVPYYLGLGANNALNINKLLAWQGDIVFPDPAKYTSNRGLTKEDQQSPFETVSVNNRWIKEQHISGTKAGTIINAASYQKFVPYNTSYESLKHNIYGISRQDDQIEYWSGPNNNIWNNEELFPSNYKKEPYNIQLRTDKLLVTDKTLTVWQTDIFGNNYGIFKSVPQNTSIADVKFIPGELWVRDVYGNINTGPEALSSIYIDYVNSNASIDISTYYSNLTANEILDIQLYSDLLLIKTNSGVAMSKFVYDTSTKTFFAKNAVNSVLYLPYQGQYYGGEWYREAQKELYASVIVDGEYLITYYLFKYDINTDVFSQILAEEIIIPYEAKVAVNSINKNMTFTYNEDTSTFLSTILIRNDTNTSNVVCLIETKNIKEFPYVSSVTIGV